MTVSPRIDIFLQLVDTVRFNKVYNIPQDTKTFSIARSALGFFVEAQFRFSRSEDEALSKLQELMGELNRMKDNPIEASHLLRNRIVHAYRRALQHAVTQPLFTNCAKNALMSLEDRDRENEQLRSENKPAAEPCILLKLFVPEWYHFL